MNNPNQMQINFAAQSTRDKMTRNYKASVYACILTPLVALLVVLIGVV